jgi:hypothetical protein
MDVHRRRRLRWMWPAGYAGPALLGAVLLSACSGSLHPAATTTQNSTAASKAALVCPQQARADIARDLGASGVSTGRSVGTNGMPQCKFTARLHGHAVSVLVNVDNGPQVQFRLDRTVEEATQLFGPVPPGWHAPQGLFGLGPYAAWFISEDTLMASNGPDLLSVTVTWPHASKTTMIKLARAAIAQYMRQGHNVSAKDDGGYPG